MQLRRAAHENCLSLTRHRLCSGVAALALSTSAAEMRIARIFNGLQISLALRKIKLPDLIPSEKASECVRTRSIASTG
jgi:hypothetical protein